MDNELKDFLDGVVGIVEANPFEKHILWKENNTSKDPMVWEDNNLGLFETVGYINGMPVCISILTSKINSHKILFYEATSQIVDYRIIDSWFKANLPQSAFRADGYLNSTNAMNFNDIFTISLE